jgi:N6-adenosine-specific RNA methylase IME4
MGEIERRWEMKKYQIIYADPPWDVKRGPDYNSNGPSKPLPYPTMSIQEIKDLPVKELGDKDSVLFIWGINKYIPELYEIAKQWGYKPSCLLTWCKPRHGIGIGGTFVQTSEHLLLARRGTRKALKRIDTTWFEQKRGRHSEKPQEFRQMITDVFGDLPRVELFARIKPEGWDVWGNEVESDISFNVKEGGKK